MQGDNGGRVGLSGRLEVFGFDATDASIDAIRRPKSWRVTRALIAGGLALGIAPVVALVPPHFPWLIGALITGGVLAQRRLSEHYTLLSVTGTCPKCGESVAAEGGRLLREQTMQCGSCGQESRLLVDL